MRSHWLCLPLIVASAEPPRTVKSSPPITTARPSISARPNTKFDGVSFTRSFRPSYSARPAILPISWKLPGSASLAMRSRMVRRPPSCCRLTRSGPPSSSANDSRRRSSSISSCQSIGPRPYHPRGRGPPSAFAGPLHERLALVVEHADQRAAVAQLLVRRAVGDAVVRLLPRGDDLGAPLLVRRLQRQDGFQHVSIRGAV